MRKISRPNSFKLNHLLKMKPFYSPGSHFRQCVGIDVSKTKFTACMCMMTPGCGADYSIVAEFSNTKTGFNQLVKWARKEGLKEYNIHFLLEPTSTYYEDLAYHLYKLNFTVYVVVPRRVHAFFIEEGIRTKTDAVDAKGLALMGCSKNYMKPWNPPSPTYRELRQLTRFSSDIKDLRGMISNQREAVKNGYCPSKEVLSRMDSIICNLDKQLLANEKSIVTLIDGDEVVKQNLTYIASIPGIGFLTAATILAETDGFALMTSQKQVASFAGLDVRARDSGTITPKRHISKSGNVHLRRAMFMCAMTAKEHNPQLKALYLRLYSRSQSKMLALTALMRKLLVLSFTLVKNKTLYSENT